MSEVPIHFCYATIYSFQSQWTPLGAGVSKIYVMENSSQNTYRVIGVDSTNDQNFTMNCFVQSSLQRRSSPEQSFYEWNSGEQLLGLMFTNSGDVEKFSEVIENILKKSEELSLPPPPPPPEASDPDISLPPPSENIPPPLADTSHISQQPNQVVFDLPPPTELVLDSPEGRKGGGYTDRKGRSGSTIRSFFGKTNKTMKPAETKAIHKQLQEKKWASIEGIHSRDASVDLVYRGAIGTLNHQEVETLKNVYLKGLSEIDELQINAINNILAATAIGKGSSSSTAKKKYGQIEVSKLFLDFGLEGDKIPIDKSVYDVVTFKNTGTMPLKLQVTTFESLVLKLQLNPNQFVIKPDQEVEMKLTLEVFCTTKISELLKISIEGAGNMYIGMKLESKMSAELDYNELKYGQKIGTGGFGAVHKGEWRGQKVALKNIMNQEDFDREKRILLELRYHPNIVQFIGACSRPPLYCLVTEFIEMGSLDKYIDDEKFPFPIQLVVKMAYDVAKGMDFLHKNNILHLDLKPQNLLVQSLSIDAPVCLKVADFGVSRSMTSSETFVGTTMAGTLLYQSPEMIANHIFSQRGDVWCYGVCLLEMVTRQPPYTDPEFENLKQHEFLKLREEGTPPGKIPSTCPEPIKKMLTSCFSIDHTLRPSFNEICMVLSTLRL